ncbi:TIGR01906 family membrane protein [Kocuria sp. TGY1127_2]|uniref:TIGR01906 family membrane protein n=1 Tax=Kocuria sp. TGY1127_2 TaxID=2711328 RepID=UPI0015C04520|nr:TIGR01906 family membrane protein [Kocuria sp. TGY1127_2]
MPVPSRPDDHETPWAESPQQDWDNLLPAVKADVAPKTSAEKASPESDTTETAQPSYSGSTASSPGVPGKAATGSGAVSAPSRSGHRAQDGNEKTDRVSAREAALEDRPKALRLRQVVIAVAVPLATLMVGIRLIATPVFLWFEYHRPGFPGDSFGFSTEDRMTYGSYGLNYILNFAPARYLADVATPDGDSVFTPAEVSHMTDVKHVMLWALLVIAVFSLIAVLCMKGLRLRAPGAIRKSIFWGAWLTLGVLAVLGILGALGWESFFTGFHEIFFSGGNWAFRVSDSLIRLFPEQFWVDSAVGIGLFSILVSAVLLISAWPTAFRRQRALKAAHDRQEIRERLSR